MNMDIIVKNMINKVRNRKISRRINMTINRKGMVFSQIAGLILALFAAVVILMIIRGNVMKSNNFNAECETNNGLCVNPEECLTCTTSKECRQQYGLQCDDHAKICCPKADVLSLDKT